ncbi:MAG: biotin--[acetyl-CoA-carboxylase] ligase [Thermoanaerobaculales bacterium]
MNERLEKLATDLRGLVENLVQVEAIDSTHAMARRIIKGMDEEDQELCSTLILADYQDRGEGRGDHRWVSPSGGLYLNWLRSSVGEETITRLPMLAAAAARQALSDLGVEDARIKWPNDILVGGRKLAGIVVFARRGETNWATVGLGVNLISAPDIDDEQSIPATAVAEHLRGGDPERWRDLLICSFMGHLSRSLDDPESALGQWRDYLIQTPGDSMRIRLSSGETVSGELIDLSSEGFLRIREGGVERVITSGDLIES